MTRLEFHPLGPGNWPVTSPWRGPGRPGHRGVDLGCYKVPLYASVSGRVWRGSEPSGAGWFVNITTLDGRVQTKCFHMSRIDVPDGARVVAGEQIGVSGGVPGEPGAGNTGGAHLHFEIWEGGVDTNPLPDLIAVSGSGTPTPTPPPEEDIDMTADELSRMLDEKFASERNHNYAIRDQAVWAITEAIVRADSDDATEEDVTRKRDELLAVIKPQLDRIEGTGGG